MNKSAKNFGYGFSALALALSSVNLPAILGTASAGAVDCPASEDVTADCEYKVKTAQQFKDAAAKNPNGKAVTITLAADINVTSIEDGAVFSTAKTIDLNGKTLTGGLTIKKGANVVVKDTSAKKTGKIVASGAVVTVNIEAGGNAAIDLQSGSYTGSTLVSRSGSVLGAERVTVSGGDFTKVASLTDGTDYARSILLNGKIAGGVFAANPVDYKVAGKNVFTNGSQYALAAGTTLASDIAAGTYNNGGADEALGTVTYGNAVVNKDYGINNSLSYSVTTVDEDDETVEVAFDEIFELGKAETDKDANETTVPVSIKKGAKAGEYKLTVAPADITATAEEAETLKEEFDITIVDAAEQLISDFYIEKGAANQVVAIDTKAVDDYAEATGLAVNYESSDEDVATVDANGQVTVKPKAGTATITVSFGGATEFTYDVVVLDTATVAKMIDVTKEDVDPILVNDFGAWTDAAVSNKGSVAFEDVFDGAHSWDQEYVGTKITPTSAAGISTRTYTYTGAVASLNETTGKIEVKNGKLEKTLKVYTVKVNKDSVALKFNADPTKNESVDLATLVSAPAGVEAEFSVHGGDVLPDTRVSAAAADDVKAYDVEFSALDAAPVSIENAITVSGYKSETVKMVAEDDAIVYGKLGTPTAAVTLERAGADTSEFNVENEAVEIVDDEITYTGAKNGSEKVSITETLGGKTINTGSIEFRTFGLDIENNSHEYIKPGESLTITAADNYGTVKATSEVPYTQSGDTFVFTPEAKAGKEYTVTLTDYLNDDKAIAANGGNNKLVYTVTVHVDDYFITSSKDSFVVEAGEASDKFEVKTSDAATPVVEITNSVGEAAEGITLDSVSSIAGVTTYKVSTANTALPGVYKIKLTLQNGGDSVELKLKVTQHVTELPDGIYTIASIIDESAVIDIPGQSKNDGASAQVYKANGTRAQQFSFTKDEDGFYTIRNLASGKVLEATGTINNGDVQQNSINGKDNQKWAILLNIDPQEDGDPIISFTLASKADENYVIDLPGRGTKNGTNVQIYSANDTVAQKFIIVRDESFDQDRIGNALDGKTFKIRSTKNTDMVLDVAGRSKENGGNVQAYTGYDPEDGVNAAQTFTFEFIEDGEFYVIHTNTDKDTDRVLDVANGGTTSGTNVWQYKSNGTLAQKWIVKEVGDQKYSFQSVLSGLYLDLANNPFTVNNGSNLQTYTGNGTTAQIFTLDPVE